LLTLFTSTFSGDCPSVQSFFGEGASAHTLNYRRVRVSTVGRLINTARARQAVARRINRLPRARYCQHTSLLQPYNPVRRTNKRDAVKPRPMSPIRRYRAAARRKGQRLNRRPVGA